jgi:hypothetical protein
MEINTKENMLMIKNVGTVSFTGRAVITISASISMILGMERGR